MPSLRSISGNTPVHEIYDNTGLSVKANRTLFESLVNNLAANAVRHNRPGGEISVSVSGRQFTISNTSDGQELDKSQIFNRFYRPSENSPGNGLGLAIVKAICEYHGWSVDYRHPDGQHHFTVTF